MFVFSCRCDKTHQQRHLKEKGLILTHGSRVQSIREGRSTWLQSEAAGHMASTIRKQTAMRACWCSVPFLCLHGLGFQTENGATHSGQEFLPQLPQFYLNQDNHAHSYPSSVSKVTLYSFRLTTRIKVNEIFPTELLITQMKIRTIMRYYPIPITSPIIEMWKTETPVLC